MTDDRGTLWDRLPLRFKGAVIVGAPVLALLLSALTSFWFDRQNDRVEGLVKGASEAHMLIDHVSREVDGVATGLQRYTITEDSDALPRVDRALLADVAAIADLRHPATGEPYPAVASTSATLRELLLTAELQGREMTSTGEPTERQEDALDYVAERLVVQVDTLEAPAAKAEAVADGYALELATLERREQVADGVTLLIGLLGGVAAVTFFARNFSTRISALGNATEHLAAGDFSRPFPRGSDEIGELADRVYGAFSRLKEAEAERDRRALRMAQVIQTMSQMASAKQDVARVHELLLERAQSLAGAEGAALQLEHEGKLKIVAGSGPVAYHLGRTLEIERSMTGRSLLTGKTFVTGDIELEDSADWTLANEIGTRSAITIPLSDAGRVVGVLAVHSPRVDAFGEAEVTDLEILGGFFGAVISKIHAYASLEVVVQERTDALAELRDLHDELAAKNDALVVATHEATTANSAKSEFLSRMSHELRTPLNAILGFAQLLQTEPLDEDQADSVAHIEKAGRHLLGLINEVLEIARSESGICPVELEAVDLDTLVTECVDLVRPLAAQRQIALTVDAAGPAAPAIAHEQKVKQIVLNLLSNAVKYNHHGGTVHVSLERGDDTLRVSVADSGPGIPPDKRASLFTPFERLGAEDSTVEGSGLGLAVSKQLASAMGGDLTLASGEGPGCTFVLQLNRSEPGSPLSPHGTPPAFRGAPAREQAIRVLYVEDNPANARLVERVLAARPGIDLVVAATAKEGVRLAETLRPALVLLDIHLPDASGVDVLERLAARPETAGVPVVVVSADATAEQASAAKAAGAAGYLTKPFDVAELVETVERFGHVRVA